MIAGAAAQLILGRKSGSIDWAMAFIAGLSGSFVGGLLASLLSGDGLDLRPSGLIGSIVGASWSRRLGAGGTAATSRRPRTVPPSGRATLARPTRADPLGLSGLQLAGPGSGVPARGSHRRPTMVSREIRGLGAVVGCRPAGERMLGRRARPGVVAGRGAGCDPRAGARRRARAVGRGARAGAPGSRDRDGHRLRPGQTRARRGRPDRPVDAAGGCDVLATSDRRAAAAEPGHAAVGRSAARDDLRSHRARRGVGGALLRRRRSGGGVGAAVPGRHRHGQGRGGDPGLGRPTERWRRPRGRAAGHQRYDGRPEAELGRRPHDVGAGGFARRARPTSHASVSRRR